ncbi:hypothetical protein GF325_05070, partial [Candidatus Bathyarchaeota archaeon]|nr:hypothetical protein [Candidatus Bathyarchaeota archaeon]
MNFKQSMKVFIRNNQKLGLGEIFRIVKEEVGSYYKVVFQGSPVKVFYNHELIHAEIPAGMLVKTTYGIGRILDSPKSDADGYFHYEIEFMNPRVKKNLKETVIKKIMPGVRQVKDLNPGLIIPSQIHGLFITGYFLDYILPTDSRFQAICHGRIEAFPYQISVINQVLGNYPSRFLLCDEVGLGKTIEACAVLKELSLRKIVNRAIIIVPASLVLQWKFELESKFNLDFTVFDGSLIRKLKRDNANLNPWKTKRMILTSLQLARRDEHRKLIKEVNFDIAIFDEAHHLRRYHNSSGSHRKTKNYELGEAVASKAGVVLLLTATPMQLNPFELFSLIKLLDPAMFPKYSDFMEFKEKISHYNFLLRNFEKFPKLNVFEKEFMINSIIELFDQESWEINENNIKNGLYRREGWLRQKLVGKITEKHLLSNILIRNKKKHAFHGKLPKRKIKIVLIEPNPEEIEVYNALRQYITHVYQRSM